LVQQLPYIIKALENHEPVGQVCEELTFCSTDNGPYPDPTRIQNYTVNLDLPPRQRWKHIWGLPYYQGQIHEILRVVLPVFPDHLYNVEIIGDILLDTFPYEYAEEIRGGAEALNMSAGLLALVNLGYEIQDYCTSIVAQAPNGQMLHARNMDFGVGMGFTDILRNITIQVDFQSKGKTVYRATTFVAFIGFLSAMRPGGFSVTVDTRFLTGGIMPIWQEIINSILNGKTVSLVSFLVRDAVANYSSFSEAFNALAYTPIYVDVYYIMAGSKPGDGVVITRNQTGPRNLWWVNPKVNNTWFVAETNYDHWEPAPWYDDRIYYANKGMEAIGQKDVTLEKMFGVLSTKPVLNKMTVYSILMNPLLGEYSSWHRHCNDPCPE